MILGCTSFFHRKEAICASEKVEIIKCKAEVHQLVSMRRSGLGIPDLVAGGFVDYVDFVSS